MAAFKIRRAQEEHLTANEEAVFEDRATGLSWRKLAEKWGTNTFVLNKWLKAPAFPDRWPAWKALDEVAAEAKASDAEEILDDAADQGPLLTSEMARIAVARSEFARWHAGVLNRARFGTAQQGANVVLNIGSLHLTAVRELNLNPPPAPAHLFPGREIVVTGADEQDAVDLDTLLHG